MFRIISDNLSDLDNVISCHNYIISQKAVNFVYEIPSPKFSLEAILAQNFASTAEILYNQDSYLKLK